MGTLCFMAHLTARSGYESLVNRLNRAPQGAPPSELLYAILKMPAVKQRLARRQMRSRYLDRVMGITH